MTRDSAAIRDQLGNDPSVFQILMNDFDEELIIEDLACKLSTKGQGSVWIVGSPTNAIVGAWTGTASGGQLTVGPTGQADTELVKIINPNNTFKEYFLDDEFKGTGTTAAWGSGNLVFTDVQTAISKRIATDNVTRATFNMASGLSLNLYLSNDGNNYTAVTNGVEKTFANSESALSFMIVSTATTTATTLSVRYS